jgi:transposase
MSSSPKGPAEAPLQEGLELEGVNVVESAADGEGAVAFIGGLEPVARREEAPISQIPKDFGISETCLHRWMRRAEIEDGLREGLTLAEEAEIRDLRKRNRLLEQENEVLRRAAVYLGQGLNPK